MRKIILIFIFSACKICFSQINLVVNPSFENYGSNCDVGPIYGFNSPPVYNCFPWKTPTQGSPDVYKRCGIIISGRVPQNWAGYQQPKSDSSYAGIGLFLSGSNTPCLFAPSYFREYLQGKIISELETNKKYCVSLYVSLADSSYYATDAFGVYFSNTAVSDTAVGGGSECRNFPYTPQVVNLKGNIITDTANWVLIKGLYTAIGGEKYITIGNFAGDTISTIHVPWGNPAFIYGTSAYYYIDDVSVIEITEAEAGQNKTICRGDTTSIGATAVNGVIYSWQPTTGLSNTNIANPIASPTTTTTYYLTVMDTNSVCRCTSRDSMVVSIVGRQYSVISEKNNICIGESLTLTASGGINYAWSGGLGAGSSVIVRPSINTTYSVTITDSLGCTGTATSEIKIINCDTATNIEVPNVLTPNADNNNDEFKIKHKGEFESFSVKIFNRWGGKIFESQNINFTWDARTNTGYIIPDGTYYYIISATGKDGKDWELHGSVTVIR